jgi:hypothetical protein
MNVMRALRWMTVGFAAWMSSSCAPSGFQDVALVNSVRILASSADEPYAKPGDTVNLQVLAYDGRTNPSVPMTIYWLPFVCENPTDDAYYACFQQIEGGAGSAKADGGAKPTADGGLAGADGGAFQPGVDLTQFLPTGPTYQFTMPADAITSHPVTPGVPVPYGLAILFNIACAGHIEIVPFDPSNANPQQVPIGCFDANHNQLGPDDWVFGFTRVYAYSSIANANPVISSVDIQGESYPVTGSVPSYATTKTFTASHCTDKCATTAIGPIVPASSQEAQSQLGPGNQPKEEIWADFYATYGSFSDDARLLYDPTAGSLGGASVTDDQFTPPTTATPSKGFIWIVVHDNRGGASWVTVPVQVM